MKPRLFTVRKLFLLLIAAGIFGGLAYWISQGMPLPGQSVPSTKGKIAFVSTRGGHPDIYMMNGSDGSNAVALTNDAPEDQSPSFSMNGSEVTFTSENRNGPSAQVYRMDARPGARTLQVTNTSSSKSNPVFFGREKLLYLNGGKVEDADITTNETEAILPDHELKELIDKRRLAMQGLGESGARDLFSSGAIEQVAASEDGTRYFAVLKLENGQALLMFAPDQGALIMLGIADKINVAYASNGKFVATFTDGAPFGKPHALVAPEFQKQFDENPALILPPMDETPPKDIHALAVFDKDGNVVGQPEPFPMPVQEFALSPDGTKAAFAFSEGEHKGLLIHSLNSPGQATPVFLQAASQPAWSPDGTHIAFVSGPDIYVVSASGGEEAKNLTNGNGINSQPAWSPAVK
jgi:Tol biopolymer transport system component